MNEYDSETINLALEACREYREMIDKLTRRNEFLQMEVDHFKKLLDKPAPVINRGGSSMRP